MVRQLPFDDLGITTRADALRAGWTPGAIEYALRSGEWTRVRPGVYRRAGPAASPGGANRGGSVQRADTAVPDRFEVQRQALLVDSYAVVRRCRAAVLSHRSAAIAHGIPTLGIPVDPCVTVPRDVRMTALPGAHLHRAGLPLHHLVRRQGVPVTSIARTVVDLARDQGVKAGVVAADAVLADGDVGPIELAATLDDCHGWPGVVGARESLAFASGRSESPMESLSRWSIHQYGLPEPTLQAVIGNADGLFVARVDFYWDEFGVVGECDGGIKYDVDSRQVVVREKRREIKLDELGLITVRWDGSHLAAFDRVAGRLEAAFLRGAHRTGPRAWRFRL